MKNNEDNRNLPLRQARKEIKKNTPGYPASPAGEDIYNKYQEEKDINPEDILESKALNENDHVDPNNEKNYTDDEAGEDLDVPGSELDDEMEIIGSEDEENNYYSLGSDDHNDLDEDKGE
jgi:hypothetical protein